MIRLMFCKLYFLLLLFVPIPFANGQTTDPEQLPHVETLIKQNPKVAFVKIKRALTIALKKNDSQAAAIYYQYLAELFYYQAAYSQALAHYFKADALLRKLNRQDLLAGNLNKIGKTYYYNRQYGTALKTFQQALNTYKKLNNNKGIAETYGDIGQTYEKTGDYKKAFTFQRLALTEYKNTEDQAGIDKIYENLGSIYEDRLQLDSALVYFTRALHITKAKQNKIGQIEIVNNMGDVYRKTGRYKEAMVYTRQATSLAKDMNEQYQLASAYRDLAKTFDLQQRYDSAYHYSEAGRSIFVDIFSADNRKQLLLLQTLFETEQKNNAIVQFEKDKKINTLLSIAGLTITVLGVGLGASIISRQRLKLRNEKKLNEQNQIVYEAQKNAMEADLELKSKELTSHTLNLIQKNQLLEELKTKLNEMVKDEKRDQKKELKQLINLISFSNNQDKNWSDFRIVFERVHENFFERLKKYSSALTSSELRLVALLKMNLASGDIATLLGISQDSLRISRYRLRKKLNLEEGENLSAFLQRL